MFNPHARWDRSLPGDDEKQWEAVEVVARFLRGKIIPLSFVLSSQCIRISRIHYSWTQRQGRSLVYYFNVSDQRDQYRLVFECETMSWYLMPRD